MAMYAIAITPLIQRLEDHGVKQAWYADDATAGGALKQLKQWWEGIAELGPDYGYFPNATKTCLVVKEEHLEEAKQLFQETGVSITADGKRHLLELQSARCILLQGMSNRKLPSGLAK